MHLYLNDLSLTGGNIQTEWNTVFQYINLVISLRDYKIFVNSSKDQIILCGKSISELMEWGSLEMDKWTLFLECMGKHEFGEQLPCQEVFSENTNFLTTSELLAQARFDDLPVVSFTFGGTYSTDSITGFYRRPNKKSSHKCEVKNLYNVANQNNKKLLISFSACRAKDPEKEPLWNQSEAEAIIAQNQPPINASRGEIISYLYRIGSLIAETNGWTLHKEISSRNSSQDHKRTIFFSDHFSRQNTYLSIDYEKPVPHFELCDRHGHHLKEIKWDGTPTGEHNANHNIKV